MTLKVGDTLFPIPYSDERFAKKICRSFLQEILNKTNALKLPSLHLAVIVVMHTMTGAILETMTEEEVYNVMERRYLLAAKAEQQRKEKGTKKEKS